MHSSHEHGYLKLCLGRGEATAFSTFSSPSQQLQIQTPKRSLPAEVAVQLACEHSLLFTGPCPCGPLLEQG